MNALTLKKQNLQSDKPLYLEASREGRFFKVGIRKADAAIWSYEDIPVAIGHVESRCRDMVDAMNAVSRKVGTGEQGMKTIQSVGRLLADMLLSPRLKEKLLTADSEYLLLSLDDQVVHIPWELLDIGEGFLCEQFKIGRMVKTRQQVIENRERPIPNPMRMWILANPGNDLASAGVEGVSICDITDRMNEHETVIDTSVDSEATREHIRENLKNFDMVHFAGHADFDPQNPEQSGWRLKNSSFKAIDIYQMMGGRPMPSLVFSNACQSARTGTWTGEQIAHSPFGLANAFMLSGVRHYIGTSWDITDEPGSRFARNFYQRLLSGMTVGESVRQAQQTMNESGDICWASYVLYGNPQDRYFAPSGNGQTRKTESVIPISIPDNPPNVSRSSEAGVPTDAPNIPRMPEKGKKSLMVVLCIVLLAIIVFTAALIAFRKTDGRDSRSSIWHSGVCSIRDTALGLPKFQDRQAT